MISFGISCILFSRDADRLRKFYEQIGLGADASDALKIMECARIHTECLIHDGEPEPTPYAMVFQTASFLPLLDRLREQDIPFNLSRCRGQWTVIIADPDGRRIVIVGVSIH